jgi:DNA-binding MarR family transcriptional regulator
MKNSPTRPRANPDVAVFEVTAIPARLCWLGNRMISSATAAYGEIALGFVDARVIYALGRVPGSNAAAIATKLGVDPAAISRTLKGLRKRQLVALDAERSLSLTEQGWAVWQDIAEISEERYRRLTDGFTDQERRELLGYLDRMQRNMPKVSGLGEEMHDSRARAAQAPEDA